MRTAWATIREHLGDLLRAWDQFWFTPTDPATLCAIRVMTGFLLLWTHIVWTLDLSAFFGPDGWLPAELHGPLHAERFAFSYFDYIHAAWLRWSIHIVNLIVFFMLMIGLFSRFAAFWSFFAAINYAVHVSPGAFFGLDKINVLLVMYVMLAPCGARYSVDRLRQLRKGPEGKGQGGEVARSAMANLALRLIQLHLCIVYLFSGLGKLQGVRWWDGTAIWFGVANVEYQSLNMTWMANHLWLVDLLTHATVIWELFYCCLVWNRLARPWVLLTALGVHGFIGMAMGLSEFALAMLVANAAFLSPGFVRAFCDPISRRLAGLFGGKTG